MSPASHGYGWSVPWSVKLLVPELPNGANFGTALQVELYGKLDSVTLKKQLHH